MEEYQLRVIEEKKELDIKRENLKKFVKTDIFNNLDLISKQLMLNQKELMLGYSVVLHERITHFEDNQKSSE